MLFIIISLTSLIAFITGVTIYYSDSNVEKRRRRKIKKLKKSTKEQEVRENKKHIEPIQHIQPIEPIGTTCSPKYYDEDYDEFGDFDFLDGPEYLPSYNEPPANFTAIDFETATNSRMACQLGVVRVEDNKIIYEKSFLIRPPLNEYDENILPYHHIRPEMTEDAPTFKQQWEEIRTALKSDVLVAHNMDFDFDVLGKNLNYYDLEKPDFANLFCTMNMLDGLSLDTACSLLGISLENHHDALCDAKACAELLIYYSVNYQEAREKLSSFYDAVKITSKPRSKRQPKDSAIRASKISSANRGFCDNLESIPDNYFKGKTCVITGTFEGFPYRDDLAALIKKNGGRVSSSISSRTNILVVGDAPGPCKIEKARVMIATGCDLKIINEEELNKVI